MSQISFRTVPQIPLIQAHDDLAVIVANACAAAALALEEGDILVLAQKIVSKAEGRQIDLDTVEAGADARRLASETDKDPRLVQLILDESSAVVRYKKGVIIVRHRLGHVGANAGIDQSNIEHAAGGSVLLLPQHPDRSAYRFRRAVEQLTGVRIGVIIADSMNRPWRLGTVGNAIGCAGIRAIDDLRGEIDMFGRELKVAMVNRADSIAASAALLMGESVERTPVVIVRGLPADTVSEGAQAVIRPAEDDMFRD